MDEQKKQPDFSTFLAWEKASRDTIDFKKIYVDMVGDLIAGLLLAQIIYWHLPDEHGNTKLRVRKNDKLYLVKSRKEWWDECRLSEQNYKTAIKKLKALGIVETEVHRFRNFPTTHIYLNQTMFMALHTKAVNVLENPVNADIEDPVPVDLTETETVDLTGTVMDESTGTLTESTPTETFRENSVQVGQSMPGPCALKLFSKDKPVFKDIKENDWNVLIAASLESENSLMDAMKYTMTQIERGKKIPNAGGYMMRCLQKNWPIDFEEGDPWRDYFMEVEEVLS